jgi:hypothetical protein
MTKPTTKKTKRTAKRLFPRKKHSTRPFTIQDYDRLKGGKQ